MPPVFSEGGGLTPRAEPPPSLAAPIIGHRINNPVHFTSPFDVLHLIKVRGCVTN